MLMKRKQLTKWASRSAAALLAGAMVFGGAAMAAPVQTWAAETGDSIVDETKTGKLTITKKAESEDGNGAVLSGAGYTLYQVMEWKTGDQAGAYKSYKPVAPFDEVLVNVEPDDLQNYSSKELEALIDELKQKAETEKVTPVGGGEKQTGSDGQVVFEQLPLGYYLVVETTAPTDYVAGSPFLIAIPSTDNYANGQAGTQWVYEVEAVPKNSKVGIEKDLAEDPGNRVQDGSAAVGDIIKYEINTVIPDYAEEYFEAGGGAVFTIKDTMSAGLAIQNQDPYAVEVWVGEQQVPAGDSTYLLTAEPQTADTTPDLSIAFASEFIQANRGKNVKVFYYAEVTEDAVVGVPGNENTVTLEYNNAPGVTDQVTPPEVKVYSFAIDVVKFTEESGNKEPLEGAEFSLYRGPECTDDQLVGKSVPTGKDGTISFSQIDAGTYYLKETKSPAGYTLLTSPIKIEIVPVTEEGTGKLTGEMELKVNDQVISPDASGAFVTHIEAGKGTAVIAVENHKGFILPATGGTGVALFLLIGAAGILTVSAVLVKKSRKAAK